MILITGAGGWLGSELTKQLLEKKEKVRAFNFVETENLKKLKEQYPENLEIVIGNICDNDKVEAAFQGVESVYHLAAKVHVIPTNKEEEQEFYKINTEATKNIFEKAVQKNIKRVIFFSTVSVYEQTNNKINIKSTKKPNTIYGKSKLEAEKIGNNLYNTKNLPITIIEPVTVYGEGDVGNFKKLESLIQKRVCLRFGNGKNKKTVIYYKDLIKMVIKIANDDKYIGKTVICGTEVLSINEINNILVKKYKKKVLRIYIPQFIAKIVEKICSISILKKIKRKVMALTQSNDFEIEKILEEYTKFEEYELREVQK